MEDPGNPALRVLSYRFLSQVGGQSTAQTPTTIQAIAGGLYYMVIRVRGETDAIGDAAVEMWVNDQLIYSDTGLQIHVTPAIGQLSSTNVAFVQAPAGSANQWFFRNFQIHDAWTSADGVKPPLRHVIDGAVSDVTVEGGTTWTNEGGAATDIVALSDSDDDTYVQTTEADAHTVVGFDRPVGLTTQPTLDAVVRTRGSRGTSLPNTIAVAIVTDNTGATETSTTSVSLSTVGAARENIQTVHQAVGGTKMFVKVTNGS